MQQVRDVDGAAGDMMMVAGWVRDGDGSNVVSCYTTSA